MSDIYELAWLGDQLNNYEVKEGEELSLFERKNKNI